MSAGWGGSEGGGLAVMRCVVGGVVGRVVLGGCDGGWPVRACLCGLEMARYCGDVD